MADVTYLEMTEEHLGDMATSEDLEIFISDCLAYQELTNCTDAEATEVIWHYMCSNRGDAMEVLDGEGNLLGYAPISYSN